MASTTKTKGFNLIKKGVEQKQSVKVEKDWYILFNILFICLIILLSGASILFKAYLEGNLNRKSQLLAQKININLNTNSKELIKSEIGVVNDKYSIYQDFLNQNFDVNTFYEQFTSLYPGLKIDKFSAQPTSKTIEIGVRFDSNGYTDLPKFIKALESSARFKNTIIRGITFSNKESTTSTGSIKTLVDDVANSESFVTQLSLSIVKVDSSDEGTNAQ